MISLLFLKYGVQSIGLLASYSRVCSVLITVRVRVLPACHGPRSVTDVAWSQLYGLLSVRHEQIPGRERMQCRATEDSESSLFLCGMSCYTYKRRRDFYTVGSKHSPLSTENTQDRELKGRWALEKRVSLGIGQGESQGRNAISVRASPARDAHLPGPASAPVAVPLTPYALQR